MAKTKGDSIDFDEACAPAASQIRRSQVMEFDSKKQSLSFAEECNPVNCRHPDRWDRIVQCKRKSAKILLLSSLS